MKTVKEILGGAGIVFSALFTAWFLIAVFCPFALWSQRYVERLLGI